LLWHGVELAAQVLWDKLVRQVLMHGERNENFDNSLALNILNNAFFNHLRVFPFFFFHVEFL